MKSLEKIRRYWKVALSYGLGLYRSLSGPITVHIETTNICNFRCIYCPQSNPDDHFKVLDRGKMSFDNYKIILDKILDTWPLREIILTRDGEPLVHPELERFVSYTAGLGLDVTIGSNGSYFTKERVAQLLDNGLTKVKGDFCADKVKFEHLRTGAKWETVLDGYSNLLEYAQSNNNFHLVLVDLNTYDLTSAEEVAASLGEMKKLFPFPDYLLSINPAVMHNSFDQARVILSSSRRQQNRKYNLCHHPWIELIIDYKGNAVGCCRDLRSEYILGNILECTDVENDIWNGEKMRTLRDKLYKRSPESISTCSRCDLPYGISYAGQGVIKKMIRFINR